MKMSKLLSGVMALLLIVSASLISVPAGQAHASDTAQTAVTIYRLSNSDKADGYFYTANQAKAIKLVNNGWTLAGGAQTVSSSKKPVYRLYNPNSERNAYFYTANKEEADVRVTEGWKHEGIAFYLLDDKNSVEELTFSACELPENLPEAPKGDDPTPVTLYRTKSPVNGEFMYTTDVEEARSQVSAGFDLEGSTQVVKLSDKPVYRLYNKESETHLYTINVDERNEKVNAGWQVEGTAFYLPKDKSSIASLVFSECELPDNGSDVSEGDDPTPVTLYRLPNPNNGDIWYSTNLSEVQSLEKNGWKINGIAQVVKQSNKPVHRLILPLTGLHTFTARLIIRDEKIKNGWKYEGVAFYLPKDKTDVEDLVFAKPESSDDTPSVPAGGSGSWGGGTAASTSGDSNSSTEADKTSDLTTIENTDSTTAISTEDKSSLAAKAAAEAIASALNSTETRVIEGSGLERGLSAADDSVRTLPEVKAFQASHSDAQIMVKPRIEIVVKQASANSISYEVTPKIDVVMTAGNEKKTLSTEQKISVNQAVTVNIPLPASMAKDGQTLYICHKLDNGTVRYYRGTVKNGILSFINVDGFSEFIVMTEKPEGFVDSSVLDVFRLYDSSRGEHFYTANNMEMVALVQAGWKLEGVGFQTLPTSTSPVYRLYNRSNGGMHFFTTNVVEKEMLANNGWKYEGISFYSGGSVPVYRSYNPNSTNGEHNYTKNLQEQDMLKSFGWKSENISWYAVN